MAAAADQFTAKYLGYIHVDKPSGGLPDPAAVMTAAKMLKSDKKGARALHPLFARGLDTDLIITLADNTLRVTIKDEKIQPPAVVMDHPIHKVAYVVDVGTCCCFIIKRPGKGKFNCHSFDLGKDKIAHDIAMKTATMCNEMFAKVRRVSHRIRKQRRKSTASDKTDDDVSIANAVAETEAASVQEAIKEADSEAPTAVQKSDTVPKVDFIDGLGDKLAEMVLGGAKQVNPFEIDLDSDEFRFGEISGEADC